MGQTSLDGRSEGWGHKPAQDNHANRLNPDAEAYRRSHLSDHEEARPAPSKQISDNSR